MSSADRTLVFTIHEADHSALREIPLSGLVIAGWTGRDPIARDKHIVELEELGIARPATTPIFYRIAARRLTTSSTIETAGEASSGEVEFVLIQLEGRLFVGVGSDHTDRKVESYNITVSKQMCDKPIAPELWAFEEVAPHWDRLVLRSYATIGGVRELYQEGSVAQMLPPLSLIEQGFGASALPEGVALFGGTLSANGGIRPSTRFEFEIHDPILRRGIKHNYSVVPLPVLG
ncbi:DUF2848 domain-containing protein [Acidiphilium sp. AL]|uniref:DUF2848 domain-containing protein n=1 Tax=Acidiphilium iwatense TaxID=768198 RepID=A0ABS9E1M5_9PROT|nr:MULTISPECIES: DUF2848 domain-containing protein [Acidiphilium]MCF3948838.1 DUF2848 domain-containing protein [Acidiphilium iwatense]MCU4162195.1 DUF2848 domain-containing protein [Acidiphilium sp. AL]